MNTAHIVGATSKIITMYARVISTGLPYTGGAFNTSGLSVTYTRDGATPQTITTVTATAGTYTSSGFVHRGKGAYEIGAPTAALADGADGVEFMADGVTDVMFVPVRVELSQGDPRAGTFALEDGGITNAKFAAGAIDADVLASDTIANAKIADGALTAAKLASDTITAAKVAADVTTEIQSGLATAAALATVDTNVDTLVSRVTATVPTAAQISTQVNADAIAALDGLTASATALTVDGVAHTITRDATNKYITSITAD